LRIKSVIGICAGLALGTPALATPQIDPTTAVPAEVVSSSGLDLTGAPGAAEMLARLKRAASVVCGGEPGPAELDRASNYRACTEEAVDRAVSRLGSQLVADLNTNRSPNRLASDGVLR
jgi:UrcA family protein